ncbi:hypothetical protein, partial [Ignavigranum ruoffiae]|uniref:hypothetical protein n=1 Tax=Ignavigranum ruoffiae TaxID=89093 RepID=UPI0024ACA016
LDFYAKNNDVNKFLTHISDRLKEEFSHDKLTRKNAVVQNICDKNWCTSSHAIVAMIAFAIINVSAVAIDTTFPFKNFEEENIFFNGVLTLAKSKGGENFKGAIYSFIEKTLHNQDSLARSC